MKIVERSGSRPAEIQSITMSIVFWAICEGSA